MITFLHLWFNQCRLNTVYSVFLKSLSEGYWSWHWLENCEKSQNTVLCHSCTEHFVILLYTVLFTTTGIHWCCTEQPIMILLHSILQSSTLCFGIPLHTMLPTSFIVHNPPWFNMYIFCHFVVQYSANKNDSILPST